MYRVLIGLIPAPRAEAPNLARRRQIKLEVLAKLTGFTKRWVIELLPGLEKKNLIGTEGGSGTVKWIWRLALGVPRLGRSSSTQFAQKEKMIPGQAKAPRVTASQPKHRRKEAAQNPKPTADVNVAAPVGETGGEVSSPAPGSIDAIDPASQSGTCRPGGPGSRGDPAAAKRTSRSRSTGHYGDKAGSGGSSRSGCADHRGYAAGTRQARGACRRGDIAASGTTKTSLPARVHQETPWGTVALGERPDRRTSGLRMLPTRHSPRFEGARHDRTPVAPCSGAPLPAAGTLRVDTLPG